MNQATANVAVITGAAGGLGHAFALRLAAEGLSIAVVDCVDTGPTVRAIRQQGGIAQGFHCDLRQPEQIGYLRGQVLEPQVRNRKGLTTMLSVSTKLASIDRPYSLRPGL